MIFGPGDELWVETHKALNAPITNGYYLQIWGFLSVCRWQHPYLTDMDESQPPGGRQLCNGSHNKQAVCRLALLHRRNVNAENYQNGCEKFYVR